MASSRDGCDQAEIELPPDVDLRISTVLSDPGLAVMYNFSDNITLSPPIHASQILHILTTAAYIRH
jgi:hypothetical protein